MEKACGKVYHLTEEAANWHADNLKDYAGARPNVYQCRRCGQWHVGYDSNSKLNKRGRRRRKSHARNKR